MTAHNAEKVRIERTPYYDLAEPLYDCPTAQTVEEAVWKIVAHAKAEALREAVEAVEPGGTGGPGELPDHWSAIERLSFLSGMDRAARILRDLRSTPDKSSE